MTLAEIAALLGLNLALILAAMAALWAVFARSGRIGFLDGVWPLAMAALAAVAFALTHGDPVRKGLLLWLVALWALPPVGWIGWTGAVLAVVGIGVEGVGSLRTAPAADAGPPKGLRRWLRRPDHLGDLAVWWGLFLIAAETGPGRASVLGPIFLTWAVAHWIRTENPRRERDGG